MVITDALAPACDATFAGLAVDAGTPANLLAANLVENGGRTVVEPGATVDAVVLAASSTIGTGSATATAGGMFDFDVSYTEPAPGTPIDIRLTQSLGTPTSVPVIVSAVQRVPAPSVHKGLFSVPPSSAGWVAEIFGTITLFAQGVGKTTLLLNMKEAGDSIADVAGPLGKPSEIEDYGTAVVVGGGVGAAIAYPVVAALRTAGNEVIAIVGGRSRDYVLLEAELAATGAAVIPCTDDGTYGRAGFVT